MKILLALAVTGALLPGMVGQANAAPSVCRTSEGGVEVQDPTKSPIRADVMPNGDVTFHFKDDHPKPITINGYEPIPNPTPGINRNLQEYLHKKAKAEHMRCMTEERHKKYHPNGPGHGVKK